MTNGIEINGLHEDATIIIDGFTLHNKGMNIQGWGNLIDTTGDLKIINNIITDVENGSVSAIHVNANAETEFADTFEVSNNYIANIGETEYATNGVYITLTMKTLNIRDNVIRDVNHTSINFSFATIQEKANITGNVIENWNRDGIAGSGAGGSQGYGIYITKTNTTNTVPILINHNRFSRDPALGGVEGKAARCTLNKGLINLNDNYWGTDFPFSVISGGTYANVTLLSLCDEQMSIKNQTIGNITVSTSDLYLHGKTNEKKISVSISMLDKTMNIPMAVFTTDTPEFIDIETRDDGVYYVAKKAGNARIITTVIDAGSNEEFKIEKTLVVKDLELTDEKIKPNESVQMNYQLLPVDETLSTLYKKEWTSSDETVATIDENGLVTSTGKEGITEISLTIKLGSTVYYHAKATVTIAQNTAPIIHAEDRTLTVGDHFDPLDSVSVTDKEDGDISDSIEIIKNDVDSDIPGIYEVIYKAVDSEGLATEKSITVTVKDIEKVVVTITAVMDGTTEKIWKQEECRKGHELDSDELDDLYSFMKYMESSEEFKDYQWEGFYLDKEGKVILENGYLFDQDTIIYVIGKTEEEKPGDQPSTDPEDPVKPEDPSKPEEIVKPEIPTVDTITKEKDVLVDTGSVQRSNNHYMRLYMAIFVAFSLSYAIFYTSKRKKELNQLRK